jgi:hypothetical protein
MALSYSRVKSLKTIRGIKQAIVDITLDPLYVNGGWPITWSDLKVYTGFSGIIYNIVPPSNKGGYSFEWDQVNGKLKASAAGSESFREAAIAAFTQYPANTPAEQAAALCKCADGTELGNLAVTGARGGYTANYQLFPDTPAVGDAVYFGAAAKFGIWSMDMSATVAVYNAAGVLAWQYWNGTAWTSLTLDFDGTGSTGTAGDYFGEQDGIVVFNAPRDWASTTVDSQAAYWIRAVVQTGKAANMTTVGLTNSKEHLLNTPDTGYVPTRNGLVNSVSIHDQAATLHTANDIKLILVNTTTGQTSGEFSFAQDLEYEDIPLPRAVPVTIADKLAIYCTQEDGTNEAGPITLGLAGVYEALAADTGLDDLVLRCDIVGS